jgi:hypothetical protein
MRPGVSTIFYPPWITAGRYERRGNWAVVDKQTRQVIDASAYAGCINCF